MKELGMYIHIPFCIQKCFYCDFCSFANRKHLIPEYINALTEEMKSWKEKLKEYRIKSIFIGGGTPSIISIDEMDKVLRTIYLNFDCKKNLEFSIESNPGTLEKEKLAYYLNNNINRLSIGLQAWQDNLLKSLGRIHNQEVFLENFLLAREIGFKNINIDLMFGLPEQTLTQWQETLYNIVALRPEHISAYSLKIEENTVFDKLYESGVLQLPSEEQDRAMYHFAIDYLQEHEYIHYEISNFSTKGKECIHNKMYWNNEEYIGFGLGAHSCLGKVRFSNTKDLNEYINKDNEREIDYIIEEKMSQKDEIAETMFLGLRMIDGIEIERFTKRFSCSPLKLYRHEICKLKEEGLIHVDGKKIRLTRKGIDLSNQVFVDFLPD
ncbi:radical SAM family heme chaperone HemW [Marinisporobacter balticus]|uniref:Heme chaperone HemW n=1 Tax=Marinisporobacter balticus TaxID=2018667 RepID=A0A4R2L485_9FIRM|nr:radical SAM family heme chaperone HemW [Marinisporobacter balticus]TCO80057.1 oxygen-independent coproporphyrinogen-3 oxidase [Marinisporobacter balticus]